jgi:hypothetical protein
MNHNQRRKLSRLQREIAEFAARAGAATGTPRQRATVTRANRCLIRRCRELDALMRVVAVK